MLCGNLNNMIVFILKYKFQKYKINSCLSFRTTLQAGLPQYDIEILKPVNMLLSIQRNLAATWYVQIPGMEIKGKLKPMQVSIYIYMKIVLASALASVALWLERWTLNQSVEGFDSWSSASTWVVGSLRKAIS